GMAGNDVILGGAGDDLLFGGEGNDAIVGGEGNDYVEGDAGSDLIIGGLGSDYAKGGGGDDLLIGGTTSHDNNEAALRSTLAAWATAHAVDLAWSATIYDDGQRDVICGGAGVDRVFAA